MTLKDQDQKEIMEKLIMLTDKDKLEWGCYAGAKDQGNGDYIMQQYFKAVQIAKNGDIIRFYLDLPTRELELVRSCRTIAKIIVTQDLINSVLLNSERQAKQAYKEDVERIKSILDEMESEK